MEGHVPIIVLALGAAALGGPEALRLLLVLAGQSPVVDIAICVLVLAMVTAQLLGVAQLARFVRKPRAAAGRGARRELAMDLFAKTTLTVSVGVAFVVTACLVAAPGGGLMGSVFDFAAGNSPVAGILLCIFIPLLRVLRRARNAGGAGMTRAAYLTGLSLIILCLLLFISLAKPADLDALRLFHGFTNTLVGVGAAAAVGTVLLAGFYLRPRRSAAGAGDRVPVAATGAERFGKLREMVVFLVVGVACIALSGVIQYAYAPPAAAYKPNGGKRVCSA